MVCLVLPVSATTYSVSPGDDLFGILSGLSGTGEGLYIGCNDAGCTVSESVFEYNFIHDLGGTQGDGIEIKTGSWGNTVRGNVIVGAGYPAITMYGFESGSVEAWSGTSP